MKTLRMLLVLFIPIAFLAASGAFAASAQDAPGTLLESYGFPEFSIDISENGFVLPGSATAGRTLITLHNSGEESRHAFIARLPDDLVIGDLFAEQSEDAPPEWLMRSSFPGFPGETLPGETRQVIVDLVPGLYLIAEDHTATFVVLPGDEATPSPVADPESAATVSLFEYGFDFPDTLASGDQVWKVVNAGREPHELLLASVPDGFTLEDVQASFEQESGEVTPVGGIGWLTPGMVGWTEVDLAAGTYVALCFVFDPATGMPHALEGMAAIFTVE